MKSNELRIGNFILYRDKIIKVNWQEIKLVQEDLNNLYQPILLTEEILSKCVFKSIDRYTVKKIKGYIGYLFCDEDTVLRTIQYLYQLQNLYFALTNEELEINL